MQQTEQTQTTNPTAAIKGGCRGRIVKIDEEQLVWVDYETNPSSGPLYALLGKPFDLTSLQEARANQWEVYLEFEGKDPLKPVIQRIYYPILDEIVKASVEEQKDKVVHVKGKLIILDAEEIILNAGDKIQIHTGESRIFMNAVGDIVQKAKRIISRSTRTTKVKGGVVEIN